MHTFEFAAPPVTAQTPNPSSSRTENALMVPYTNNTSSPARNLLAQYNTINSVTPANSASILNKIRELEATPLPDEYQPASLFAHYPDVPFSADSETSPGSNLTFREAVERALVTYINTHNPITWEGLAHAYGTVRPAPPRPGLMQRIGQRLADFGLGGNTALLGLSGGYSATGGPGQGPEQGLAVKVATEGAAGNAGGPKPGHIKAYTFFEQVMGGIVLSCTPREMCY